MNHSQNMEDTHATSRLLSELDLAIDRSSAMRDIVSKYERLRNIENITGPSRLTRVLRKEIQLLENRLATVGSRERKNGVVFSTI